MPAVLDPVRIEKPRHDNGSSNGFMAQLECLNQDHVAMDTVVVAFCRVLPGYTPEKSVAKMLEIHNNGVAVVFSGTREVCELYCEQLNSAGLDTRVV